MGHPVVLSTTGLVGLNSIPYGMFNKPNLMGADLSPLLYG